MSTLILLGAKTSNGTSSAFLFVPDGASELSRSIESILGKKLRNLKGGMFAVFKPALQQRGVGHAVSNEAGKLNNKSTINMG